MSDYDAKIETLKTQIPDWLKSAGFEAVIAFQGFLGSEMGDRRLSPDYKSGKSNDAFDISKTTLSKLNYLRSGTGKLISSFHPNFPRSPSSVKLKGYKLSLSIGSNLPYAEIHEKGGFIETKGKMHNYFWAMWYKSRNKFYMYMALSIMKREPQPSSVTIRGVTIKKRQPRGVTIKKRPYFEPALRKFLAEYIATWLTKIFDKIVKAMT